VLTKDKVTQCLYFQNMCNLLSLFYCLSDFNIPITCNFNIPEKVTNLSQT